MIIALIVLIAVFVAFAVWRGSKETQRENTDVVHAVPRAVTRSVAHMVVEDREKK